MSTFKVNKYGEVAVRATELVATRKEDPVKAWVESAKKLFPQSMASQKKGCPRSAYLYLAGKGYLVGVPSGNYTRSTKNGPYALEALQILQQAESLPETPLSLWQCMFGNGTQKVHNGQMDVVIGLWQARLFTCQHDKQE